MPILIQTLSGCEFSRATARREAPAADNRLAARRADQIASLKPFATRNATFFDALLALIRISSPVTGLRPLRAGRAGRIRTCRTPRLGMRILLPFFSTAERSGLLRQLVFGLHRLAVIVRDDPGLDQKLQDIRSDAQRKG